MMRDVRFLKVRFHGTKETKLTGTRTQGTDHSQRRSVAFACADVHHDGDPRLIKTLSLLNDALELRELLDATESGRFWYENDLYFNPDNRVDNVLLANLLMAFRSLKDDLGTDGAQALLMQTMFIAYLEDREIIGEAVFRNASQGRFANLMGLLNAGSPEPFEKLFTWLHGAFNGNLFKAPCAFEADSDLPPKVQTEHLSVLARFRLGQENMATHQLRFWGYNFRYMSIGLISAVYDRFLKEEAEKKSADGAFYTPMFLADMVVNQVWDELTDEQKINGTYCDPACGSGIFLVRLFQRLRVGCYCRDPESGGSSICLICASSSLTERSAQPLS